MADDGWLVGSPVGTTVGSPLGAFVGSAAETVTIGTDNVEVDFVSGRTRAIVDFNHVPLAEDDAFILTAATSHADSLAATTRYDRETVLKTGPSLLVEAP